MTAAGLHARAGTWPDKGQQNQPQATTAARGLVGVLDHTPEFAHTYAASVTSVAPRRDGVVGAGDREVHAMWAWPRHLLRCGVSLAKKTTS